MSRWRTRLSVGLVALSSIFLLLSGCGGGTSSSSNNVSLGSPAWSPDGRKVVFTRCVARSAGIFNLEDTELYTANLVGSGMTRLTTDGIAENSPRWSPDGTRLVFSMTNSPIYVINADGSGLTSVSPVGKSAYDPDWSPDGQHIVYSAIQNTSTEIYTVRADGTDERRITQSQSSKGSPRWSPDGTRIAFVDSNSAIVIVSSDGTNPVEIPHNSLEPLLLSVIWAPDGKRIAFTTQGFRSDGSGVGHLYVANADGTGQPTAISPSTSVVEPDWSKDGTQFLFVGDNGLASMKTDGSDVHLLPLR